MFINRNPRIWEFDVDDTLFCWNLSDYPPEQHETMKRGRWEVIFVRHQLNINLLIKLAKIGWFIRVHSGSGVEWAEAVIRHLGLEEYVDFVEAKPLGKTDDQPPGDGLAYTVYRKPA